MKKLVVVLVAALVLMSLAVVPALAGKNGPAGKSNVGHLYLYEKDPDGPDDTWGTDDDWSIVDGGAWGKFNYQLSGTGGDTEVSGVFNGKGLEANAVYSLIYYPEPVDDPWTAPPVVEVIGSGTAKTNGNVHIMGSATIGGPDTQPDVGDYIGQTGDKIWLVLASDLAEDAGVYTMTGWNPTEYLFECSLINTP